MTVHTPPKFGAIIEKRYDEAKLRKQLEDFAEFCSVPEELVDMYLESR